MKRNRQEKRRQLSEMAKKNDERSSKSKNAIDFKGSMVEKRRKMILEKHR
jgi:hypothetical protein